MLYIATLHASTQQLQLENVYTISADGQRLLGSKNNQVETFQWHLKYLTRLERRGRAYLLPIVSASLPSPSR